nr:hypothetical protein [uncultured organism]
MPAARPITGQLHITAWRNDDWFEYPLRVVGRDLTGVVLKMDVRLAGDTSGNPLVHLEGVAVDQPEQQGLRVASVVTTAGLTVTDLRIRMNKATLQGLPYFGELGEAAEFEYALLFGGRTRLVGKFILPAHAFGSDAAPDNRPSGYGSGLSVAYPNGGASLTISEDGGATVVIDGADLLAPSIVRVEDAAARAEAAAADLDSVSKVVEDYSDREDVPVAIRPYGLMRTVTVAGRTFVWTDTGNTGELAGPGEWVGQYTQAELKNLSLDFTGLLDQSQVGGLSVTLDGIRDQLAALQGQSSYARLAVDSFTVSPSVVETGASVTALTFAWSVSGAVPNAQVIERADGQRLTGLNPAERSATATVVAPPAGILFVSDSQGYDVAPGYATAFGLPLAMSALYSQTIRKQAGRIGATPITLTLAGGSLPAAGTQGTVTLVNGQPTTSANPDAVLHASNPDTDTHSITGVVVGRQVTITYNPAVPDTYKIAQTGGAAIAVPDGSVFTPGFKAMAQTTHRVVVMAGHNDMRQDAPAESFAAIRFYTDAIMALCADNPHGVQLFDFWPADNAEERALIPYIEAHSHWLRDKFPGAFAFNASGQSLWECLRNGDKVVPSNLRRDVLHLNGNGNAAWVSFGQADAALHLAGLVPITSTVDFTYRARGAVAGAVATEVSRTATVFVRTPVFAGLCAGAAPTAAEIRGAQYKSFDSTAIGRSLTLNRSAGGRPFFVFPAALALTSIRLGGFAVTGWVMSDPFNLVLGTGATVSMRRAVLDPLPASATPIGVELA